MHLLFVFVTYFIKCCFYNLQYFNKHCIYFLSNLFTFKIYAVPVKKIWFAYVTSVYQIVVFNQYSG